MAGLCTHLIVVVSGGGSAAPSLGYTPRSPAVPANVTPPRNLRRLSRRVCWRLMETSFPDAGQCDTKNVGQWTLLPSCEQAPNAKSVSQKICKLLLEGRFGKDPIKKAHAKRLCLG